MGAIPKSNRMTQDEFVGRSKVVHNSRYAYDNVVYKTTETKVSITCSIHGDFLQTPKTHLKGCGCSKCNRGNFAEIKRKAAKERFKDLASKVHGGKYSYEKSSYIKSSLKVVIYCPIHGEFLQTPNHHLMGNGCPKCGGLEVGNKCRKSSEDFIAQATSVHKGKYAYGKVVCRGRKIKVTCTCPIHGDFDTHPGNHVRGSGCPSCAGYGFQKDDPASLYVLRDGNTTKVGITNKKVPVRVSQINKGSDKNFSEVFVKSFERGLDAIALENLIISYLGSLYNSVEDKFNGHTECFYDVDLETLLSFIETH